MLLKTAHNEIQLFLCVFNFSVINLNNAQANAKLCEGFFTGRANTKIYPHHY